MMVPDKVLFLSFQIIESTERKATSPNLINYNFLN